MKICQFFKISILIVFITQFTQFAYASGVKLNWVENSVSDVAGYKAYYGTASHNYQSHVDAGTFTSVEIDGLSAGITYYFAVTAYDNSGNESAYSQEVQATIPVTQTVNAGSGSGSGSSSVSGSG
ncbi:MAG: fibronectin type III domain-containing protein, partial [Desulfomonilia bacterium]